MAASGAGSSPEAIQVLGATRIQCDVIISDWGGFDHHAKRVDAFRNP
jgi:hypothetical protein